MATQIKHHAELIRALVNAHMQAIHSADFIAQHRENIRRDSQEQMIKPKSANEATYLTLPHKS